MSASADGMSTVRQIVQREIAVEGAIPFSRFMELALYCPNLGYYERVQIGQAGDFYTSVSVGSLFGELLAFQFARWIEPMAGKVCLVEAGAHDGRLARDILRSLRDYRPVTYERVHYTIVEPRAVRRAQQRSTLEQFAEKVTWHETLAALPDVNGIIFGNELLDAFPVARYLWSASEKKWFEAGVGLEGEQFVWRRLKGLAPDELLPGIGLAEFDALLKVLPDGHTLDVSPSAVQWWREAARKLSRGKLLTLDYGLTAEQLLAPERSAGTLRGYHKHHQTSDLLANVGEQDLTAHVNFTALQRAGESEGLVTEGLWSQEAFLTRIAHALWSGQAAFPEWTSERTRQFQTLTHPNHLGHTFKALLQAR